MDKSLKGLLGLTDGGKRIFNIQDGEVTKAEFDYCAVMEQTLFGEKGYVDTLGPTWNMTLDPRFQVIENSFITNRKAVLGGDARQGIQTQLADGTFMSAITDLEPYAEILGEGRFFRGALISLAYDEAIRALYPDKVFAPIEHAAQYSGTQREYREGLTRFASLSADEQAAVLATVKTYTELHTNNFHQAPDEFLWQLIHEHCPNYFARDGKSNAKASQLFSLFRADLLGLIDDYAELPKYDEWVKADGSGDLADVDSESSEEQPMVYGEVDTLEKALTFRAQLRTTAARVLNLIGVAGYIRAANLELTELERDHLVRLIFQSERGIDSEGFEVFITKWPDGKADMASRTLGYLGGIVALRQDAQTRLTKQLAKASGDSKQFISDLKSGKANAITRYTEPDLKVQETPEEQMLASILNDPIKMDLFLRFSAAETNGDEDVVALLAPVFTTEDYKVSEDTYFALVAETTALLRARAQAMGAAAPVPMAHLGEEPKSLPVTDVKGHVLSGPDVIDIPDFEKLAAEGVLSANDLERQWWIDHENYAPRTFGRDPETGQKRYGDKKTAIRVIHSNPDPLTLGESAELRGKNHSPIHRTVGTIVRDTEKRGV